MKANRGHLLGLCWLLTAIVPATAKGAPADANGTELLASRVLQKLDENDRKMVAVVDLQPAFGKPGSFGPWLADQLSSAIVHQDQNVGVVDRRQIRTTIETLRLSFDDESEAKNAVALGKALGATTVIVGSYEAAENGIGITILAFRATERETRASSSFVACMLFQKMSLSSDLTIHLDGSLESMRPTDGVYKSGHGGVSVPACVKCPAPNLRAPDVDVHGLIRAHPHDAIVRLNFIIDTDGRTMNISVPEPIGFGVDEQFVRAAKGWEFKPAVDMDGKRVSVTYAFQLALHFK